MKNPAVRKILFVHLFYFFALIASINFFHTDFILDYQADCPACQFQQSNIALVFVLFQFFIVFIFLRLLFFIGIIPVYFIPFSPKKSRAPPISF